MKLVHAYRTLIPVLLVMSAFFVVSAANASGSKQLILETEPEETVIDLVNKLVIGADGRILATPTDPEVCQGNTSEPCEECECGDVDVQLSSFSINDQESSLTIDQGDSLAFRWESRGAWSCQAIGDFPGWTGDGKPQRSIGFQHTVDTGTVSEGIYTAGLRCANGPVLSDSREVTITVDEESSSPEPDPGSCSSARQLPTVWQRQSSCVAGNSAADCRKLSSVFGGDGSLMSMDTGNIRTIIMNTSSNYEYVAMEFNTSKMSSTDRRRFSLEYPQNPYASYNSGTKMITVSTCPGDFNKQAILDDGGCYFEGSPWINNGLVVGGTVGIGGPDSTATCKLELGKSYYLNILYTSSPAGTEPEAIEPSSCADGAPGCGDQWSPQ